MVGFEKSYHLLCAGPVNVHADVANAAVTHEFGHRDKETSALLQSIQDNVLAIAELPPDKYASVIITGSGTAGNEAVLASSVSIGDKVLVLTNGEFGERLASISELYNETLVTSHEWGKPFDLERISRTILQYRPKLVAMVHHETSTGMLNPVEAIGEICKQSSAKLFVDMVSSFSADPINITKAGVTFLTTSSGKAIASYPGLALVIGLREEFHKIRQLPARNHYLNLGRYLTFWENKHQTPNTPSLPLALALNQALQHALTEGISERFARLSASAKYLRSSVKKAGFGLYIEDQKLSNVLTSILLPSSINFELLQDGLRDKGFVIYGGKGHLSTKLFQASTIGQIDHELIDQFVESLSVTVSDIQNSSNTVYDISVA